MLPGIVWQTRLQTVGLHTAAPLAAGAGDAMACAPPNPSAATVAAGQALAIEFADGSIKANVEGADKGGVEPAKQKRKGAEALQASLFES